MSERLSLWPLIGTEKVRSSPFAHGWYRGSLILFIYPFLILQIVISLLRYGNQGRTLFHLLYYSEVNYQVQDTRVRAL
jgi:hypothetical protein